MDMLQKRTIAKRIELRIKRMREILDDLEVVNNTFNKQRIKSDSFYVLKIDKETRKLISCCNAIIALNNTGKTQ